MFTGGILAGEGYHAYLNTVFIITTVILALMIYLIWKQSSRLEEYKFYLLNNIIWSYALLTLFFASRPRFLFPRFLIYFDGPLKNCGPVVVYGILCAFMITAVNMICGILMTLGFRYGQLLPFSISILMTQKKLFWPCVIGVHVFGYCSMVLPILTINCNPEVSF